MREIKFRAWDNASGGMITVDGFSIPENDIDFKGNDGHRYGDDLDKYTLLQYTGLKDKNGKEIYEGDIIKSVALSNDHHQRGATSILIVRFFMGNYCLCYNNNETGVPIYPLIIDHEIEIIGNIYENPDLYK